MQHWAGIIEQAVSRMLPEAEQAGALYCETRNMLMDSIMPLTARPGSNG